MRECNELLRSVICVYKILPDKNRDLKTRFCFMELESIRLEIHAALYFTDQLMEFARQKLSLKDLVLLFRTRVYKTRDLCGINNSNLACENRVFEP